MGSGYPGGIYFGQYSVDGSSEVVYLLPANILIGTLEATEIVRTLTNETPERTLEFTG